MSSQPQRWQRPREEGSVPYPAQGHVQAQRSQHHTEAVCVPETIESSIRKTNLEERYHEEGYHEEPLRRLAQGHAEFTLILQSQSALVSQGSTHGQVQSAKRSSSPRLREAAETLCLLAGSGLETELPDSRQVPYSNDQLSHQHINTTATAHQLSLSHTRQHAHESASPLNPLATSTPTSALLKSSHPSNANIQAIYKGSNVTDSQPSLPEMKSSEIDVEKYLDGVEDQSAHNRNRRILEVLDSIYNLPTGQRGTQLRNFVSCLELSQGKQDYVFRVLRRRLQTINDPFKERYLVTKWLLVLVFHAQEEAMKARDAAKLAEQVKPKAPLCGEGFHKLRCGHYRASHEVCGMNCYGRSTFPDKPLNFDARMSEIVCFKCLC
ncbi:hypothetical protein KCU85_g1791, partial [Aureobasidium melanogenum]